MNDFCDKYGPWAVIAGGAQGIGEAYARFIAARGVNLVLLDVNSSALGALSAELIDNCAIECVGIELDLARPDMLEVLQQQLGAREVGLLVYNAGLGDVGPFYKPAGSLDYEMKKLAINVAGPLQLSYHFARPMLERRRGGIILMSSGAGWQGSPYYAHYSATKAYDIALAEGLWGEFKPYGVDVLACVAGMTLSTAAEGYQHLDTSEFQTTTDLVAEAMAALGQQSTLICGENNRRNHALLRELPREKQIEIIGRHAVDNFFAGAVPEQDL